MKQCNLSGLCILLIAALVSACGGGGSDAVDDDGSNGGDVTDIDVLTGVFIDSPVEGLRWVSGDMSGATDEAGTFQYQSGETVQFYVGDILIGSAAADSVLTPIDLVPNAQNISDPTVTNIYRFLMTLDNDNDPSNGIQITAATSNLALGESIDFDQSTADFSTSGEIQVLVAMLSSATDAGASTLTSVSDARDHAENSIKALLAGTYSGTFSGADSGTWTGVISTAGTISGTATSYLVSGAAGFAGTVNTNGSGSTSFVTSGGVSDGTLFSGVFSTNGSGTGTWSRGGAVVGRWSGSKN